MDWFLYDINLRHERVKLSEMKIISELEIKNRLYSKRIFPFLNLCSFEYGQNILGYSPKGDLWFVRRVCPKEEIVKFGDFQGGTLTRKWVR